MKWIVLVLLISVALRISFSNEKEVVHKPVTHHNNTVLVSEDHDHDGISDYRDTVDDTQR